METLKKIVKGCIKQNKVDQHKLYAMFSAKMYGVCLRYASNMHDAQDILQEGFIKVFENLHTFKWQGSLEGWMKKIMINSAIEKYRLRVNHLNTEELWNSAGNFFENEGPGKVALDELLNMIQELPDQYRMVFNLSVIEGYNHKEIGQQLGILESTSRSNLARARHILQQLLMKEARVLQKVI